jgi:HEAT repeat protein
MKGKNLSLRATAAYAIWRIGGQVDEPVNTLIAMLNARDEHHSRSQAAWSLQRIGPPAKSAVPALRKALVDGDESLRSQAAQALQAIDPDAAKNAGGR